MGRARVAWQTGSCPAMSSACPGGCTELPLRLAVRVSGLLESEQGNVVDRITAPKAVHALIP